MHEQRTSQVTRRFAFVLGLALLLGAAVRASESGPRARVETTSGRVLEGVMRWDEGGVSIDPGNQPTVRVELAELRRLVVQHDPKQHSSAQGTGTGLLGFYYPGTNFQGAPIIRLDGAIDFNWGWNTVPLPGFRHDLFSIRWTGLLEPPRTDVYTIYLGSDDGSRFWVDGQGPFSMWRRQDYAETNCTLRLEAGRQYPLQVDYFDYFGSAQIDLSWSSSGFPKTTISREYLHAASAVRDHAAQIESGSGLLATYHVGSQFGEPSFSRVEPVINLESTVEFSASARAAREEWVQARRRGGQDGFNAPDQSMRDAERVFAQLACEGGPMIVPGVPLSFFSVRWSGQLRPLASGVYAFRVLADEGVRLWLNEDLVIDRWDEIFPGEYRHLLKLVGDRPVTLRMETLNTDGQTVAKLFCAAPDEEETLLSGPVLLPMTPDARLADRAPPELLQVGGVLLSKGTFVPLQPVGLDATVLRLDGPVVRMAVPRPRVARIYFRPLTSEGKARLAPDRTGALLENGDFVEGDVLSLNGTEARVDSVLFGRRAYHAPGPVTALILQRTAVPAPSYQLVIKGLGTVLASEVRLTPAGAVIPELLDHTFAAADVLELNRLAPR